MSSMTRHWLLVSSRRATTAAATSPGRPRRGPRWQSYRRADRRRRHIQGIVRQGWAVAETMKLSRQYAELCDRRDFDDPELRAQRSGSVDTERLAGGWRRPSGSSGIRGCSPVPSRTSARCGRTRRCWPSARPRGAAVLAREPRRKRVVATDIYGDGEVRLSRGEGGHAQRAHRRSRRTPTGKTTSRSAGWMPVRSTYRTATSMRCSHCPRSSTSAAPGDIARAAAEIGRVLRPGGHALIVTECLLGHHPMDWPLLNTVIKARLRGHRCPDATPHNRQIDAFTPGELLQRIVAPSGLRLMQPLDLVGVTRERSRTCAPLHPDGRLEPATGRRYPHLVRARLRRALDVGLPAAGEGRLRPCASVAQSRYTSCRAGPGWAWRSMRGELVPAGGNAARGRDG